MSLEMALAGFVALAPFAAALGARVGYLHPHLFITRKKSR